MRLFPLSILNLLHGPPRILRRCATESGNLQDRAGQAEVRAAVAEAQLMERDTITVEQKRVLLQSSVF